MGRPAIDEAAIVAGVLAWANRKNGDNPRRIVEAIYRAMKEAETPAR